MAHCGECHTPRNLGFALDNRHKFAGATTNGWRAFNISADKETGIGGWTDEALASYLSTGFADGHGVATGPMGEAVGLGLRHLTPDAIRALVVYLYRKSVGQGKSVAGRVYIGGRRIMKNKKKHKK